MSAAQLTALLPLVALGATAVIVMLASAFWRSHVAAVTLTLLGLGASLALLPVAAGSPVRQVTALLLMDDYALLYIGLLDLVAAGVAALSYGYLKAREPHPNEYYMLLLLATLGAGTLVASAHFASFFLGLEILSISLYTLIAYPRLRDATIEAGLKYLILAGTTASFLLFGMALVYSELGTMSFASLGTVSIQGTAVQMPILIAGMVMILVGVGFKLALVPFHLWTPDVYQGAPAPVTAFVATASKGAMAALALRLLMAADLRLEPGVWGMLALLAILSMIGGNLLALQQANLKRLLAYSSIAHLGYLLVAFLASRALAATAVTMYLAAYTVTTLGAFGIITVLSPAERDAERIDDYRGLVWRRPWLGGALATLLFSLAGIPLTAGFVGKLYVLAAGAEAELWGLVVVLVLSSAVGLYYYLRVIVTLFAPPEAEGAPSAPPVGILAGVTLVVLVIVLFWLGIYPTPLLHLVEQSVAL